MEVLKFMLAAGLAAKCIYLYKPDDVDTLVSYEIADFSPYAVRLNGAGAGDLDNDGQS